MIGCDVVSLSMGHSAARRTTARRAASTELRTGVRVARIRRASRPSAEVPAKIIFAESTERLSEIALAVVKQPLRRSSSHARILGHSVVLTTVRSA